MFISNTRIYQYILRVFKRTNLEKRIKLFEFLLCFNFDKVQDFCFVLSLKGDTVKKKTI